MLNISLEIKELLESQKKEWELVGKNFAGLKKVQVCKFSFDDFTIKVQFNPGRIVSSTAKVDKKSIEQRQCFLCETNRPKEQCGVDFGSYSVLVNPFPIFPEHLTVPTFEHTPQRIQENFADMLDLCRGMQDFIIFYNGPKCGASAPDHFHFQAGNKGFMPIEDEMDVLKEKYGKRFKNKEIEFWAIKDGLRNFIVLESADKNILSTEFEVFYNVFKEYSAAEEEPMVNILATFNKERWRILIFPRALHRPWQYFENGEQNILFSPASVDMGGVLITPLEKDFNKITKEDIKNLFEQVLLSVEKFDTLVEKIYKLES